MVFIDTDVLSMIEQFDSLLGTDDNPLPLGLGVCQKCSEDRGKFSIKIVLICLADWDRLPVSASYQKQIAEQQHTRYESKSNLDD